MKIVLINPPSKDPEKIQQKCFAPVNLLYLAASLEASGFCVCIVDANAFRLNARAVVERVKCLHPDLIGISLLSEIFMDTFQLVHALRTGYPGARIVLGGPHANAMPEAVLAGFSEADMVLQGEAEYSLVNLCRAIASGKDLEEIPGLYFRKNGRIHRGPSPPEIKDLDRLPCPARHLLAKAYDERRYFMILQKKRPIEILLTSRGCPFQCRFCSNIPSRFRPRSPENVIEEIVSRYEQGICNFDFADANFTHDQQRALTIFDMIIKEKLDISFRFKSRTDAMTPRLAEKAKQAGAYLISMGMESGSQEILDRMNKRTRVKDNIRSCQIVLRAGLQLNTGWILGFPGETPETMAQTLSLILKLKPTTANIGWLTPYPGTPVYEAAKSNNTLVGDWCPGEPELPWIRLPWIRDRRQLENVRRRVLKKVYLRPYYMFNFSKEILKNMNLMLADYAIQETRRVIFS